MESVVADLNPVTADGLKTSDCLGKSAESRLLFSLLPGRMEVLLETLEHRCERCVTGFQLRLGGLQLFSTATTPLKTGQCSERLNVHQQDEKTQLPELILLHLETEHLFGGAFYKEEVTWSLD